MKNLTLYLFIAILGTLCLIVADLTIHGNDKKIPKQAQQEIIWNRNHRHFSIVKDTIKDTVYYSIILPSDTSTISYLTDSQLLTVLHKEN